MVSKVLLRMATRTYTLMEVQTRIFVVFVPIRTQDGSHNHPPPNPARRKPLAMYGQSRINRHTKPVR